MVEWFAKDDAGYLRWLAGNGDGFVLNTWIHARAGYLVVHRASCRTINRTLPPGRPWTDQYGKACAAGYAELVAWSLERTGAESRPCGLCGAAPVSGAARAAPHPVRAPVVTD